MVRVFVGVLITLISGALLAVPPAYAAPTSNNCFAFNSTTGTITGYYNNEANNSANPACTRDVEIPASIGGIAVTSIGEYAFFPDGLTSVTVPNSVTSIGAYAFYLNQLRSVTIPVSVTSIGQFAFSRNQLASLVVEGDPASLGEGIFNDNPLESILYGGVVYTSSSPNDEACFAFDADTGTITSFHQADLAFIKSDNEACLNKNVTIPAAIGGVSVTHIGSRVFMANQLTSVTIPNSVTSIGLRAFMANQLTSIIIPNSVTSIEIDAFKNNYLTSISLSNSLTSIDEGAFMFNSIHEVVLPSSLQALDVTAFAAQNQWGAVVDLTGDDPAHDLFSDDLTVVQTVLDNMWYTRLYTSGGTNPHNLRDGIMSEWLWTGDANQNGDERDSLGGHLLNPAHVKIQYKDIDGSQLKAPTTYTGVRSTTGVHLTNYGIVDSAVKAPLNSYNPTSEETDDLAAGFAQYYRSGQTKTFTAPSIAGYTTPSSKTVTFTPGENALTFIYQKATSYAIAPTVVVNGDKAITKTPTIPSRPAFSGTATPGATIAVAVHSDPITCTTTAKTDGTWACTLPKGLPAGAHTVYVKVTNPDSSIQNLGPYSVIVKTGDGATVLAPDSGVGRAGTIYFWLIPLLVLAGLLLTTRYLNRSSNR